MNKKTLALALLSLMLIAAFVPIASAHTEPFPPGYDYTSFLIDVTGNPGSMDGAYAYDTTAAGVIMNVYENLLFYDALWSLGPYQPDRPAPQRTESFIPQIASALPTIEYFDPPLTNPKSGLPIYKRFTFSIKTGITFHHGAFADPDGAGPLMGSTGILTARDVEYSFERVMVQDRAGGPSWLLYEPLLGAYGAEKPADDPDWGIKIDGAVEVVGSSIQLNLAYQYPDLAFEQILCQTWASVMSEAWAANEGDLNMNLVVPIPPSTNPWSNWAYIYTTWHSPKPSFLEDAIDKPDPMKDGGTGPFRMSYWTRGVAWSIRKYDAYRGGWPAPIRQPVTGPADQLGGYLTTVTWYLVVSWPTRLSELLTGTRDIVAVPRSYRDQVLGQVVGGEKVRSYFPITALSGYAMYFTFNLSDAAVPAYVPALLPYDTFGETGIPANIFGNHSVTLRDEGINVRRAFAYAWDYAYAISAGYLDEATQPSDPIVLGLAYDNPEQMMREYNLTKAEYYFRLAWGGIDARATDVVLAGAAPPIGGALRAPGFLDKYYDANGNGIWDVGEPAIKDVDNSGTYTAGDVVLVGAAPAIGSALTKPGPFDSHYDPDGDAIWDVGESAIRDTNMNRQYDVVQPSVAVLPEDPAQITTTGALWNGGMRFNTVWSTGAVVYMLAQQKMNAEINAMNPRFHLTDKDVDWGTIFLPDMDEHKLPVYNVGWLADFADPHNFVQPFMHSMGAFGYGSRYHDQFADEMIEQGILIPDAPYEETLTLTNETEIKETSWYISTVWHDQWGGHWHVRWQWWYSWWWNWWYWRYCHTRDWWWWEWKWLLLHKIDNVGPYKQSSWLWWSLGWWNVFPNQIELHLERSRQDLYFALQSYYWMAVPSTMVFQGIGRGFQIGWCRGYYDNKLFPGNYWYHWWKAKTHYGDVNWDGSVGMADWSAVSSHWTVPPGPGGYNLRADITGGTGGTVGSEVGLRRGIPDGKVGMADLSMVSAYWDVPPGPSHGPPWPKVPEIP